MCNFIKNLDSMNITTDDLRSVIALRELPTEHLQWIIDHSEYAEYKEGDTIVKLGEPIKFMWITLEGAVHFYMDINGKQVYYYSFENDEASGGVGGVLPYSRMKTSPGYAYAVGRLRTLLLPSKHFPALEKLNEEFIKKLVAYMTNRARAFATLQLQQEKVSALGKLAAGVAHELNNPAAAISRISHELNKRLIKNFDLTERLLKQNTDFENMAYLRKLVELKFPITKDKQKLTALQRMKEEDGLNDWLQDNNINKGEDLCETFVDSSITLKELELIKEKVGASALEDVLYWLENLVSSQRIIKDLGQASERITNLVSSIKNHVHMDQSNDLKRTNLEEDINDTLTILGHKLREKNIELTKEYEEGLPEIEAYIGELNQVWMNLIDNAIYAMEKGGKLTIKMYTKNKDIKVCFIDNGSGISEQALPRIFDPFFTTKKVGQGTGIGLDLVARIIKKHHGDIKAESVPGRTVFTICLPVNQPVTNYNSKQNIEE